jgi:tetratricopeptide (TPR) repeat protein
MAFLCGIRFQRRVLHDTVLALACCAALAGCAATRAPSAAAPAPSHADAAGASPAPSEAAAPARGQPAADGAEALPDVELTPELLYRLIYAEIAVQRGEPGPAYVEWMRAAKQTGDPRLARRAMEVALAAHATSQGLDAAALWVQLAPADRDAAQAYSSLLVVNGRYEQAQPLLERQIAQTPDPLEVLDRLQRLLARGPEPAQGFALLEAVARPYLSMPATAFDTQVIVTRGARAAGDYSAAVAHAHAALALRPDSEPAVVAVAQLLVEGGRTPSGGSGAPAEQGATAAQAEAAAILERFLQVHPDAPDARLAYARVLVGSDRLEDAQRQFEELVRREPRYPDPLFALGVLSLEAERYEEARGYFERYLDAVGPANGRDLDLVYLNMSRVAEGQRRYEEALDWLHKLRNPEQASVASEREAFILVHLNRAEEGMKLLEQLPGDTGEQRMQRVLLQGQLLREEHRYQDSFELLDQALRDSPDDSGLLYESAMSAERLDRVDVMESRLRRLLQLHPDYAHAYNALGYSLADRNIRLQEAYALIGHALSLAPDDGFIVDSMGWVQYRLGHLEEARAALTRAFRLKADPDVAAHLGEVLWAMGDHSGARTLLLEAQRRDGDSDTLRETLQRLNIQP